MGAIGTLARRLGWPAIRPAGGLSPAPPECPSVLQKIDAQHHYILKTRGLFDRKVRTPKLPHEEFFAWITQPPEDSPAGTLCYIDGPLFHEARNYARRTGFKPSGWWSLVQSTHCLGSAMACRQPASMTQPEHSCEPCARLPC